MVRDRPCAQTSRRKQQKGSWFAFGIAIRGQQGEFMILMRIVELVHVFVLVECIPKENNKKTWKEVEIYSLKEVNSF